MAEHKRTFTLPSRQLAGPEPPAGWRLYLNALGWGGCWSVPHHMATDWPVYGFGCAEGCVARTRTRPWEV